MNPLQRIWRDSATAARHAVVLPVVGYEVYGKALLGVEEKITPWYRPRRTCRGDDRQPLRGLSCRQAPAPARSPEFPTPTSFRQWCEEGLRPAVRA